MTRTGSFSVGPNGNAITSFEVSPPSDTVPVALDEFGNVTFGAHVEVDGMSEYGIYQALAEGGVVPIYQSDQLAPGLTVKDPQEPGGLRALEIHATPSRGFAMSKDGTAHGFNLFTRFDGPFLYDAFFGEISGVPRTWPFDVSEKRSVWAEVLISDGRGATQERSGGTSNDMLVSNSGFVFWERSDAIFRTKHDGGIHAIMFTKTFAAGFSILEDPVLDTPLALRGVDSSNNAVFHCRVTTISGFQDAVYRQNFEISNWPIGRSRKTAPYFLARI